MPDEIDRASEREAQMREDALESSRRDRMAAIARAPALACDQCDEPIPQARRDAVPGCRYCVMCQRAREIQR